MERIQAEKDRLYAEDFLLVASMIYYWRRKRKDNDELKALSACVTDMHKYVQGLQSDNRVLTKMLNDKE